MPQKFPFPRSSANGQFPFNPFDGTGDPNDPARYLRQPGIDFQQPWLAVPNGPAFIWPVGTEGVTLNVSPTLGIHKPLGTRYVTVDVTHPGEEHITLSGAFPGRSGAPSVRALRDVVLAATPVGGKILAVPGVFVMAFRVTVVSFQAIRQDDARGGDFVYTLELVTTGFINSKLDAITQKDLASNPNASDKGVSANTYISTASIDTLRKIALALFRDSNKWNQLYKKNTKLFAKVPSAKVPSFKLPPGTAVYY